LQQAFLEDQAWQTLVQQILVQEQIRRFGLGATEEEVKKYLRQNPPDAVRTLPAFLDDKGEFDLAAYQAALDDPNIDWSTLYAYARQQVPVIKLQALLSAMVRPSLEEVREIFEAQTRKMKLAYTEVTFPKETEYEPSEEEILAYYREHTHRFRTPEQAVMEIVPIPIRVTPRDRETARYTAELASEQARHGEDFADLAKAYSKAPSVSQGGEAGWIGEGDRDSEILEALASMKPGEVSPPIETAQGYTVVKLLEKKREKGTTRYRIQEIFVPLEPSYETVDSLFALAREVLKDAMDEGLGAAAEARGLSIVRSQPFTRTAPVDTFGLVPRWSSFAFTAEAGEWAPIVRTDRFVLVGRLVEKRPERTLELAEARPQIVLALQQRKIREETFQKALDLYKAALATDLEKAATQRGYFLLRTSEFTAAQGTVGIPPLSSVALAALHEEKGAVLPPIQSGKGYVIAQVEELEEPDEARWAQKQKEIYQTLLLQKADLYVSYWYRKLVEKAKIEDYRVRF
jgi:parvulin-like peptidyl-prolyl isomerase